MLPPFDDYGNLPPGIHPCLIEDLVVRFGGDSEDRKAQVSEVFNSSKCPKQQVFVACW